MREIHINISVPDDSDIDSVVINLKHRGEPKECNNRPQKNNHKFNVPEKISCLITSTFMFPLRYVHRPFVEFPPAI